MSGRPSGWRLVSVLMTFHRVALRTMPATERTRFGGSMEADARRLIEESLHARGAFAAVGCALRESADVLGSSMRSRRRGFAGGWSLDLRYSVRSLAGRPMFVAVATVTLATAIAASTTVFSVVDGVLLTRLPFPEPHRLARLMGTYRGGRELGTVSYLDARDVREASRTLSGVSIYRPWSATLTGVGEPERLEGLMFSSGFLEMLGIEPTLGRRFLPEEDFDGSDRVVILSHGFWMRRFGGDHRVVGRTLQLNGNPHVVVGVGPERFARTLPGFGSADVWRPLGLRGVPDGRLPYRGSESYSAIARLASGVTLAQVNEELAALMRAIEEQHADTNTGQSMRARPVHEVAVGAAGPTLLTFLGAVGFVLLAGIANVVGLFLGRAIEREQELAVRAALGAGGLRLVRQLTIESALVAGASLMLGSALAYLGTRLVVARASGIIPLASEIRVDGSVLAVAASAGVAAAFITGLAPAVGLLRRDLLAGVEKQTGRAASDSGSRMRLRRALLISQVAVSVLLVVGAGLLLRSYSMLSRVDPGLRVDLLTFRLDPPATGYETDLEVEVFYRSVEERLAALPGVAEVAFITGVPMTSRRACGTLYGVDEPTRFAGQDLCAEARAVSSGYFRTAGIPILRGRAFGPEDTAESEDVVIINETVANLLWPDADPLGRELATGLSGVTHRVVGVVPDVKQLALDEPAPPQTYLPIPQWPRTGRNAVIRTVADPRSLAPAVRAAVWDVDSNIPVTELGTIRQFASERLAWPRFRTLLLSAFAALALMISLAGVYAAVSYAATRRRRELAIRMSLGARRSALLASVVGTGVRDALVGVGLGLAGAFLLSRVLESMLFEVSPVDPLAFAATGSLVIMVGVLASLLPALHVTRVDPIEALRAE